MSLSCVEPEPADGPPVAPVGGMAAPGGAGPAPTLADLTTLRVGGPIAQYVEAHSEEEVIAAVTAADDDGVPLLVLGGGSNLLASDEAFPGTVVRDMRRGIRAESFSTCAGAAMEVPAGQPWDDVVALAVQEEWMGVEALSGIPGTTGATPVQNVGAYGQEVAETISSVRVWDRFERRPRLLPSGSCS